MNSLADFQKSSNQYQNLFTVLGHYDYQFSPANHFSIRGYGTRNHTSGFTGGLGQNEIPADFSETENFINQGVSGVFSLNTVLGRKVNEIRVSIEGETRKRHSNAPGTPTILVCAFGPCSSGSVNSSFLFGQRYYLPINGDGGKLQAADNFSYSFGKHDMKFGGDTDTYTDRKDTFVGWSSGQYEFDSLQDFQAGNAQALIQNLGLNGKPLFASGTLYNNYNSTLGLYWQDKWQITPRITLTYGLRWEGSWYPQPQTAFPGNETYAGTGAQHAYNSVCHSAFRTTSSSSARALGSHGTSARTNLPPSCALPGDITTRRFRCCSCPRQAAAGRSASSASSPHRACLRLNSRTYSRAARRSA